MLDHRNSTCRKTPLGPIIMGGKKEGGLSIDLRVFYKGKHMLLPIYWMGQQQVETCQSHPINKPENCHRNPYSGLNRFSDCPYHCNIWVPFSSTRGEFRHVYTGGYKQLSVNPALISANWTKAISRWKLSSRVMNLTTSRGESSTHHHSISALWLPGCTLLMGHEQRGCKTVSESK